jgi:hypothetical protein
MRLPHAENYLEGRKLCLTEFRQSQSRLWFAPWQPQRYSRNHLPVLAYLPDHGIYLNIPRPVN